MWFDIALAENGDYRSHTILRGSSPGPDEQREYRYIVEAESIEQAIKAAKYLHHRARECARAKGFQNEKRGRGICISYNCNSASDGGTYCVECKALRAKWKRERERRLRNGGALPRKQAVERSPSELAENYDRRLELGRQFKERNPRVYRSTVLREVRDACRRLNVQHDGLLEWLETEIAMAKGGTEKVLAAE